MEKIKKTDYLEKKILGDVNKILFILWLSIGNRNPGAFKLDSKLTVTKQQA